MDKIKTYFNIYKKEILFSLVIVLIIIATCLSFIYINKKYKDVEIKKDTYVSLVEEEVTDEDKEVSKSTIYIDIKGNVVTPGVYELDENSRVIDAIEVSGGLTDNANTRYINLSKKLKDEDVIVISSNEEVDIVLNSITPVICEEINDACTCEEEVIKDEIISEEVTNKDNDLININDADIDEFTTLDGIGESKAKKIIEYRSEHGKFKSIDELKEVSGIGDALYESIKDKITI